MTTPKGTKIPATPPSQPGAASSTAGPAAQIADLLTAPITVAQRMMPASTAPVALGAGALVLAGVIELPIAGALGLGYLALRRWRPNH